MTIVFFVDNKLGGVTSLNYNLSLYPQPGTRQVVIHIEQEEWEMSRANIKFPVDKEIYFKFSGDENTYHSIRKLNKLIPKSEGALILNYEVEMTVLDHYPSNQTSFQLVHDDYNLRLSKKYGHVVDVFVCHNTNIYKSLSEMYPLRSKEIFYLPHGVSIPTNYRIHQPTTPIKLLFLGRMSASKGIFDLPDINDHLRAAGIEFEWTCVGNGPELENLKQKWNPRDPVHFISPETNEEVMKICSEHDVFVLPTKFEGSPVSLLETMSAGLVPVVSDIAGGITDVVGDEIGFRLPVDDNAAFATAILKLHNDRELLQKMSANCRKKIMQEFDVRDTAARYHELFHRYKEFFKMKERKQLKIGARLDHPLMPSFISKSARRFSRRIR